MTIPKAQFLVDAEGKQTAVLISVSQYRKLLEDLHDLTIIAARRDEVPVPFEDVKQRLQTKMVSHDVVFKPSVEKDLRALPRTARERVLTRIGRLREDPMPRQAVKLAGSHAWYRVRVGDYRIVYGVESDERRVVVHYVRHRRDAYRNP